MARRTLRLPQTTRGTRVWIVNHYAVAPDRPAAAGSRAFALARPLVERGDEVTIFAAGVDHLTGREERVPRRRLFATATFDGVRFVWVRTFPYLGNTWRRPVNMLTYLVTFLVVQTKFERPDVVIGSTVHPFAALGAEMASRLRRARFIVEIRDLWPQTLVDIGALRLGSPGERMLRRLEAYLVRRATTVITLLPGMRRYLAEHGLPAAHVAYIPNGVDLASFRGDPDATYRPSEIAEASHRAIQRLRGEGRCVFGYAGTFGRVNNVEAIVRAAELAEQREPGRIGLILVGDGPDRREVEAAAARVPPVELCPAVPKHDVPAILRALDGTVVHAIATPVYRYGISFNKLFEYMAVGRPVVFACESPNDPISITGAGMSVPPNDPGRMADAFLELARMPDDARESMGAAGREYVAHHHDLGQLAEAFATVVHGGTSVDGGSGPD